MFGNLNQRIVAVATLALLVLAGSSGCRICCNPEDDAYSAYGGLWQRTNRMEGRVGSTLNPGGARGSALADRDEPNSPDELERAKRERDGSSENSALEPDANQPDEEPEVEPEDPEAEEQRLRERMEELRNQGLEDIKVVPGDIVPPALF